MADHLRALTADDRRFLSDAAEDLKLLARFHDRELDRALLDGLRTSTMHDWLAVVPASAEATAAMTALDDYLATLAPDIEDDTLDTLAAEYARIYLTHAYRLAPTESVWRTEDRLERQAPMFAVRDWYRHYGIAVPNWRVRSDDHIVHELQFISHLCALTTPAAAHDAAHFLDRHLLVWFLPFASHANARVDNRWYQAAINLTAACLVDLRQTLALVTGVERPPEAEETPVIQDQVASIEEAQPFMPGLAESW
jgi:TorA maturation chaperone TorD